MRARGTTETIEEVSPGQPVDLQPGDTTVWQARDRAGRMVRVKLWGGSLAPEQRDMIVAFHNQAKRLASLHSVHAMQVLGHGLDPWRRPYLITECPAGESLATRLASGRAFGASPSERVSTVGLFVHQMAAVLSELHALGRVAGVLSADDVFLVSAPTLYVKLLDVGMPDPCCSGVMVRTTSDSALVALEALAPEHASTRGLDGRVDIWPVAVLAYRMLTGAHPFVRNSYDETVRAQRAAAFVPPSRHLDALEPHFAATLDAWFSRALCPTPDGRFATVDEMSSAWPELKPAPSFPELEGEELGETLFFSREDSGVRAMPECSEDTPTQLAFLEDEITLSEHSEDTATRPRRRLPTDEIPLPAPTAGEASGITAVVRLLAPLDERGSIAPGPELEARPTMAELDAARRERVAAFEAQQKAEQHSARLAVLLTVTLIALLASSALLWLSA